MSAYSHCVKDLFAFAVLYEDVAYAGAVRLSPVITWLVNSSNDNNFFILISVTLPALSVRAYASVYLMCIVYHIWGTMSILCSTSYNSFTKIIYFVHKQTRRWGEVATDGQTGKRRAVGVRLKRTAPQT